LVFRGVANGMLARSHPGCAANIYIVDDPVVAVLTTYYETEEEE
jgi:hypothetical protein